MVHFYNFYSHLPKPVSCRLLAPLVTQYAEAELSLSAAERNTAAAHCTDCPACRVEIETARELGAFLREQGPAALPGALPASDLWARVEARIVAEARPAPQRQLKPFLVAAPVLAAVATLVIALPRLNMPVQVPKSAIPAPMPVALVAPPTSRVSTPENAATVPAAPVASFASVATGSSASADCRASSVASVATTVRSVAVIARHADPAPSSHAARRVVANDVAIVYADAPERPRAVHRHPATKQPTLVARADSKPGRTRTVTETPASHFVSIDIVPAETSALTDAAPKPLPAEPRAPAAVTVASAPAVVPSSKIITVVHTDPGSGVSEYAVSPAETLDKQRRKRGLFGGYAVAASAVMPATVTEPTP